jgi:Ser/Thr protein kinase RdoA (MazF antagonist)
MHQHARTWSMPEGANLPLYDEPLCGDEDLLAGLELSAADRAVLHEADARGRAAFAEAALVAPAIPLHADLHGGNLKWDGRRLAVFDFDDAGRGVPAFDLAVATFYLRGGDPSVEQALRAGYERAGPLPELGDEAFEALVAARQLLLLNSLYATSTATWRSEADEYLLTTLARLRAWRASGRFRLDVPVPRRSPP